MTDKQVGLWDRMDRIIPASNPDPNSQAAARSMVIPASVQRRAVFDLIAAEGPLACWQVEARLDLPHQSASARITELYQGGFIDRRGKNTTPSGRSAHLYIRLAAFAE